MEVVTVVTRPEILGKTGRNQSDLGLFRLRPKKPGNPGELRPLRPKRGFRETWKRNAEWRP
jgi:hypothetical protein